MRHTQKYYSAIKEKDILSFVTTQIDYDIILSEKSQRKTLPNTIQ